MPNITKRFAPRGGQWVANSKWEIWPFANPVRQFYLTLILASHTGFEVGKLGN